MIWFMASHDVHHRGQLSAYAKMLGLAQPPLYTGTFGDGTVDGHVDAALPSAAVPAEPLP